MPFLVCQQDACLQQGYGDCLFVGYDDSHVINRYISSTDLYLLLQCLAMRVGKISLSKGKTASLPSWSGVTNYLSRRGRAQSEIAIEIFGPETIVIGNDDPASRSFRSLADRYVSVW